MNLRAPLLLTCLTGQALHAQPDTLFVPSGDSMYVYAVEYSPMRNVDQFKRRGVYAFDTTRTAVMLDYKLGKPCGIYRAYFPDGKPLIFAVYGYGFLHGDWTEYDEFGRVTIKGQYRDGLRDGSWEFRKDGVRGHYQKGKKHGRWKYYANGRLVRIEKYHQDRLMSGGTYQFPDR
jgi:hypothetical protein